MDSKPPEHHFVTEMLPKNQGEMDPFFGAMFQYMRTALAAGGSEFGLGITLFSLAVSIRAENIIEIGRFKGFATLCLASALRFLDIGWQEPSHNKQRPDINYTDFEREKSRKVYSVDPYPTEDAATLIEKAGLNAYIEFIDQRSDDISIAGEADLVFIDGDHTYEGCQRDVQQYVTQNLRHGGYFIMHDYFGWFGGGNKNNSPIKKVIDEIVSTCNFQHVLIDTGYQSFVIFRKPAPND
jgi:predicted O-methyltransferase YrrM